MDHQLSDAQRDEIHAEIRAKRKIQAIKLYRTATGQGLYEAKQAVEAMESQLPPPDPREQQRTRGGCMPMLVLLVSVAIAGVWVLKTVEGM